MLSRKIQYSRRIVVLSRSFQYNHPKKCSYTETFSITTSYTDQVGGKENGFVRFIDLEIMWKIVVGIIILVALGALVVIKHINNAVAEYYSPGFVSESMVEARSQGVFISKPNLKSKVIHWDESAYPIREAWIEQATQLKYDWIFFERVIRTRYRLVLKIERIGNPPRKDFLYFGDEIVCNDSIRVTTTRPSTPILMYSEFSSPLPDSIDCVVKKQS